MECRAPIVGYVQTQDCNGFGGRRTNYLIRLQLHKISYDFISS